MKIPNLAAVALLAAGVALTGRTANAALTYSYGDVFLGFRGTTAVGTEDYLVNIGNVAQFSKLDGASFTVNTGGNIGEDLSTAFGATWNTDNRVSWGAIASTYNFTVGSTPVIYATKGRNALNINTQSTAYISQSFTTQQGIANDISNGLAAKYLVDGSATVNSTKGTLQTAADGNSWYSFTSTSSDFNLGGNVDGATFSTTGGRLGTATSVLDFYRIDPSNTGDVAATYLGKFTITDSGVVTFTAVPEPATYALLILAGGGLFLVVRRRRPLA